MVYFFCAKIRKKPYILWREEWEWRTGSIKMKIVTPIMKYIVKHSNAIVVPGSKHKEHFIDMGASPQNIFLMPNASNIKCSKADIKNKKRIVEKLGIKDKEIIIYVGRLIKRKGVDYLIKAFSKLNNENAILIIIGDGECKKELMHLTKELNIDNKVIFEGWVQNDTLPGYYLLSDICVIPSTKYEMADPWVFTLNEAMYFGKPVIATDAVGAAFDMIINGQNGFLVPEKDDNALYNAINKIISNPDLKKDMGVKSKEIIKDRFLYKNMIEGFNNAVNHVSEHDS